MVEFAWYWLWSPFCFNNVGVLLLLTWIWVGEACSQWRWRVLREQQHYLQIAGDVQFKHIQALAARCRRLEDETGLTEVLLRERQAEVFGTEEGQ